MRLFSLLCICFFNLHLLSAQIGINAGYKNMSADKWSVFFEGEDFLDNGFKVGIDYWFRLKKRRVEFTPEISFSQYKSMINHFSEEQEQEFKAQFYSFHFNTNFYFLNFEEDCNCPTFGKDGTILDKGFFVQIAPVVSYIRESYKATTEVNESSFAFGIGGGLGLDIGINKATTITPYLNYTYYPEVKWDGLATLASDGRPQNEGADEATSVSQWFAGLKLAVRFDEINKYGYR